MSQTLEERLAFAYRVTGEELFEDARKELARETVTGTKIVIRFKEPWKRNEIEYLVREIKHLVQPEPMEIEVSVG
jgi:hypothetical protein